MTSPPPGPSLVVRNAELELLTQVLSPVGQARVLLGDPGMGKTTLLVALAEHAQAKGWQVLRATGSESEATLEFAALYQLLRTLLGEVDALAGRQRAALLGAFGLSDELTAPNQLLVRIAGLTLLSNSASKRRLLLVV